MGRRRGRRRADVTKDTLAGGGGVTPENADAEPPNKSPGPEALDTSVTPAQSAPDPAAPTARSDARMPRRLVEAGKAAAVLLAVVVLTPATLISPSPGADGPFMWALHQADALGLQHGTDFVFTYGPWGYLSFLMPIAGRGPLPYLAGALFAAGATAAYGLWAVRTAQRWTRPRGVSVAVFAVLILFPLILSFRIPVYTVAAVAWAADTLIRNEPLDRRRALVGAALATPLILVKFDAIGAVAILLLAIAARSVSDRPNRAGLRQVAAAALVAAGSLVFWWGAAGQRLVGLPHWIRNSLAVASGFGDNMFGDEPWRRKEQLAIVACVAIVGVMLLRRSDVSRSNRVAFAVLYGMVALFGNKSLAHHLALFGAWSFPVIMSAVRPGDVLGVLKAGLAVFVTLAVQGLPPPTANQRNDLEWRTNVVQLIADPNYRDEQVRLGQATLRKYYALPPDVSKAMAGRIHIQPWEAVVPYIVPGAEWDPLPVIQDYAAYTTTLDELNRERIESVDRPEIIAKTIGAELPLRWARWEPPAASVALICWYQPTSRWANWLVLAARETSRCEDPVPLGEPRVAWLGERLEVPIPPGPGVVVMSVEGLRDRPWDRLRGLLDRRASVFLLTESANGAPRAVRFLVGHADSPHVMRDRDCGLDLLEAPDGPGDLSWFALSDLEGEIVGSDDIVVTFEYIAMDC